MVNTKIRLIIFFAAEDGNVLYSQQKQDLELSVAHIIRSPAPYCKIEAYSEESRETNRPFRHDLNQIPDYKVKD